MKIDISREIQFKTSRSGGKGGQQVNKLETQVEGYFHVEKSDLISPEQKKLISAKLANRMNAEGFLQVRSQAHRTQLENKQEVIRRINALLEKALRPEKKRIATRPGKAAREKRLESKKMKSEQKQARKKVRLNYL